MGKQQENPRPPQPKPSPPPPQPTREKGGQERGVPRPPKTS